MIVITEFDAGDPDATMHAMTEAILEYRRALRVLGRVVDLAKVGAPVAVIGPGPLWHVLKARIDLRVAQLKHLAAWTAVNWLLDRAEPEQLPRGLPPPPVRRDEDDKRQLPSRSRLSVDARARTIYVLFPGPPPERIPAWRLRAW